VTLTTAKPSLGVLDRRHVAFSFMLNIKSSAGRENQPFTLSLNLPEHLNVTTFLGSSIKSSPVAGFLPFRSHFSFKQNLPKLEIRTSSPDASVRLMISIRVSTISVDLFLGKPI
jgi:hypothetical protein